MTRLARTGLRRGLLEGSRAWLVVGVSASVVQLVRRAANEPEVVERVVLSPGEGIEIRTVSRKP
jgi:hypothetical protein